MYNCINSAAVAFTKYTYGDNIVKNKHYLFLDSPYTSGHFKVLKIPENFFIFRQTFIPTKTNLNPQEKKKKTNRKSAFYCIK